MGGGEAGGTPVASPCGTPSDFAIDVSGLSFTNSTLATLNLDGALAGGSPFLSLSLSIKLLSSTAGDIVNFGLEAGGTSISTAPDADMFETENVTLNATGYKQILDWLWGFAQKAILLNIRAREFHVLH